MNGIHPLFTFKPNTRDRQRRIKDQLVWIAGLIVWQRQNEKVARFANGKAADLRFESQYLGAAERQHAPTTSPARLWDNVGAESVPPRECRDRDRCNTIGAMQYGHRVSGTPGTDAADARKRRVCADKSRAIVVFGTLSWGRDSSHARMRQMATGITSRGS